MVSVTVNENYQVSIVLDGKTIARKIEIDDAIDISNSLKRALAKNELTRRICRAAWNTTVKNGGAIGAGKALSVTRDIAGETVVVIKRRDRNQRRRADPIDIPRFIENLKPADRARAREIFAKWL